MIATHKSKDAELGQIVKDRWVAAPRSPCGEDDVSPDCVAAWNMDGPITYITGGKRR
jgi:hypothetical protein